MSARDATNIYPDQSDEVHMSEAELTAIRATALPQRSARQTIISMIAAPGGSGKAKKRRPMLTSSQLSDLFTRLDKNGDGELDLDEFTGIIKMLKINVTPDYIARVFRSVDQAVSTGGDVAGTLDMQEFIAAYQKIYTGATVEDVASAASKRESYVRATRYGCRADGSYLFECYTIPSIGASEKHTLGDLPTDKSSLGAGLGDQENLAKLSKAKVEPWVVDNRPGTIDHLDRLIRQDSARNKSTKANVLWWVDVAYSTVDRTTAEEMVAKFGLPNNSKFVSSFGNFGNGLPADPKSRVFAGNGINANGSVYSLSFFAQALFIKNVPVVHHLPPLLRSMQCNTCNSSFMAKTSDALAAYYTSRFAWMANLSWLSKTSNDEKISAYERAEGLASLLKTSDTDAYDDADDNDTVVLEDLSNKLNGENPEEAPVDLHTIFSANGDGVPIRHRAGYNYPPTWLRSNTQIYSNPPQVHIDSLGLHILDYGYGAHALLTVREIDSEKQKFFSLEQQSRAGVLGRIISGLWVKLAEVIMNGRSAGVAGEMADSPASLVTFLLMLIHNFSMNSVASVDYWLNMLEKEIKDIVVSKHSAHLAEVERILKDFNSYLDPLEGIMQAMSSEQEEILNKEKEQDKENAQTDSDEADLPVRVPYNLSRSHSGLNKSPKDGKRRGSVQAGGLDAKFTEALPQGVEKISLSFATVAKFFGSDPYREIHRHLDGYEQLDIKGLSYWKDRLKKYALKVEALRGLIATQLDEKRNFTSFMLTIITTILAPLAVLTGYFGMNFTNMEELDENTYKAAPGVKLMWIICGVAYGVLMIVALHFRVIYSAT